MYTIKTKEFKYLSISWGRDDDDPMYISVYKHKNSQFFKRYSKAIDLCLWGRRLLLEF